MLIEQHWELVAYYSFQTGHKGSRNNIVEDNGYGFEKEPLLIVPPKFTCPLLS